MGKGIVLLWLNYTMYFPSTEEEGRHECKSVFKMFFLSASLLSESCKKESYFQPNFPGVNVWSGGQNLYDSVLKTTGGLCKDLTP